MTNLKAIAEYLREHDLFEKPLCAFNQYEIEQFCIAVLEALDPGSAFSPPFLENGCLYIPGNAPRKYRWWQDGQTIQETLEELGASEEIKRKYIPQARGNAFRF